MGKKDKAIVRLGSKPLLYHSLSVFVKVTAIKQIVLVLRKDHFSVTKRLIDLFRKQGKSIVCVQGGFKRQDSVRKGLRALDREINYVLIHDGARPFVSKALIERLIKALKSYPAVISAIKPRDTLKLVDRKANVKRTLDRNKIVLVQTPQGFKRDILEKIYEKRRTELFFDDAQMCERSGQKIRFIEGDIANFEITYPQDLVFAREIVKSL